MHRLRPLFVSLPRWLIGLLMVAMVAINLANVIGRHVFGEAVFWAEEIMVLLMVWGVFIDAIAVTFSGKHLRMDLFSADLGRPWKNIVNTVTMIVLIGIAGYVARFSYQVVSFMVATERVSNAAKYPLAIQHAALLVGLICIVAAVIVRLRAHVTGKFD